MKQVTDYYFDLQNIANIDDCSDNCNDNILTLFKQIIKSILRDNNNYDITILDNDRELFKMSGGDGVSTFPYNRVEEILQFLFQNIKFINEKKDELYNTLFHVEKKNDIESPPMVDATAPITGDMNDPSVGSTALPPGDVTAPPVDMNTPPGDVTAPPGDVTAPPVDMNTPPGDVTAPPGDVTAPPVDMNTPPGDVTAPPGDVTAPPVDVTAPPVDVTAPPGDVTAPPGDVTAPPGDVTAPPVDVTAPPVDVTAPPVDVTAPPVDVTAPPGMDNVVESTTMQNNTNDNSNLNNISSNDAPINIIQNQPMQVGGYKKIQKNLFKKINSVIIIKLTIYNNNNNFKNSFIKKMRYSQ
jgi:hypothetical protein